MSGGKVRVAKETRREGRCGGGEEEEELEDKWGRSKVGEEETYGSTGEGLTGGVIQGEKL